MPCPVCRQLKIPVKDVAAVHQHGSKDLVVAEGESLVLSPHIDRYSRYFMVIDPESIVEMKEVIGVPDGLHATSALRRPTLVVVPLRFARTDQPVAEIAKVLGRRVADDFLYRDSASTAAFVPQLDELISDVSLHVGLFQDVTVSKNSTLTIERAVDRLTVRNLVIEAGGKLVIRGSNLLINARSAKGATANAGATLPPVAIESFEGLIR